MSVLSEILAHKRQELQSAKKLRPVEALRVQAAAAPGVLPFIESLRLGNPPAIIAEVKKASPSKGIIRADLNPVKTAVAYAQHGAACISVLTDEKFFQGSLSLLRKIRHEVPQIPILRKDFILDEYQLWEARAAGADAVLLIVAALDQNALKHLAVTSRRLSLNVLLEIHDEEELTRALELLHDLESDLESNPEEFIALGINNRNLKTFVTDLGVTEKLMESLRHTDPCAGNLLIVSESGIVSNDDIQRLQRCGINSYLVGESLVRTGDPGENLQTLRSAPTGQTL
jgi:indole-3-glycerol phosphate synthase